MPVYFLIMRVVSLLALAHGAAACPDGWTLAAGHCYKLTDTSTTLGCVALCGANASLACIRSDEENAVATALLSGTYAWIGNFQRPGSSEPVGEWDGCPSGEEVSFSSWGRGEPNNEAYGSDEDCAGLYADWEHDWRWYSTACFNYLRCLCKIGAEPSPEYLAFLQKQQQIYGDTAWGVVLVGVLIPVVWLLTTVLASSTSVVKAEETLVAAEVVRIERDRPSIREILL